MAERESLMPARPDQPKARQLFLPLLATVGILLLAFSSITLKQGRWIGRANHMTSTDTSLGYATNTEPDAHQRSHYIDPHCGDNGTDPAQTTTDECTGDFTLPVLAGVDVVAFFSLPPGATPVVGSENRMALFGDYRFYFSSIENLRLFENEPLKFIPAWGGFCSYGIANESVWTDTTLGPFSDPTKWEILPDGRLHVFRSSVPRAKFLADIPALLKAGQEVWTGWFGEDEVGPLNTACFCSEAICDDQ
ncbi:unnamed protein product [Ascophyllum nodosum]